MWGASGPLRGAAGQKMAVCGGAIGGGKSLKNGNVRITPQFDQPITPRSPHQSPRAHRTTASSLENPALEQIAQA